VTEVAISSCPPCLVLPRGVIVNVYLDTDDVVCQVASGSMTAVRS
jgi:hypothetical protein